MSAHRSSTIRIAASGRLSVPIRTWSPATGKICKGCKQAVNATKCRRNHSASEGRRFSGGKSSNQTRGNATESAGPTRSPREAATGTTARQKRARAGQSRRRRPILPHETNRPNAASVGAQTHASRGIASGKPTGPRATFCQVRRTASRACRRAYCPATMKMRPASRR